MALAEVWRPDMARLAGWHLHNALVFLPRRNHHSFRCAVPSSLDERHVYVTCKWTCGEIEPAAQGGDHVREWVGELGSIVLAPGLVAQLAAVGREFSNGLIDTAKEKLIPAGVFGWKPTLGLLGDEFPQGTFNLAVSVEIAKARLVLSQRFQHR